MKAKNARDYTAQLQEAVAGRSVTFTQTYFKRYAGEFKRAIELDKIPGPLLEKAITYIAEFWDTQQLSVQKAVSGIQSRQSVVQSVADRWAGYEWLGVLNPRQQRLLALVDTRGPQEVIRMIREDPKKLEAYLKETVGGAT